MEFWEKDKSEVTHKNYSFVIFGIRRATLSTFVSLAEERVKYVG